MAISVKALKQFIHGMASKPLGLEVASAIDASSALLGQSGGSVALVIVATSTSQTVNFGALAVGDLVAVIPTTAGNSHFVTVATAGTLGEAAVIGSLYVAFRKFVAPAADTTSL